MLYRHLFVTFSKSLQSVNVVPVLDLVQFLNIGECVEVQLRTFLSLAPDGDEWASPLPGHLPPHPPLKRRVLGTRVGLDAVEKDRNRTRSVDCPLQGLVTLRSAVNICLRSSTRACRRCRPVLTDCGWNCYVGTKGTFQYTYVWLCIFVSQMCTKYVSGRIVKGLCLCVGIVHTQNHQQILTAFSVCLLSAEFGQDVRSARPKYSGLTVNFLAAPRIWMLSCLQRQFTC